MRESQKGQGRIFVDLNEIEKALENGDVSLHTKINARINTYEGQL